MNNRIAADAAAWALSKVGCPYSQEKRNQDGVFDCSSLVARAYAAQGKRWRYGGVYLSKNKNAKKLTERQKQTLKELLTVASPEQQHDIQEIISKFSN